MKIRKYTFIPALLIFSSVWVMAQDSAVEFSSNTFEAVIVTNRLQETLDFYTKVAGLTFDGDFIVKEDFSKRSGLADGTSFKVHKLKINDKPESSIIKVISFNTDAKSGKGNSLNDGVGVQMLNFKVVNMKPVITRIKEHNVQFLGDTPIFYHEEKRFVLIQDPNGIMIEFME